MPRGTADDVDRAVRPRARHRRRLGSDAAGGAARWLRTLADALEARVHDVATTISQEVGMPITMSTIVQAQLPVSVTRSFATLAESTPFEEQVGNSLVVREPFGVAGLITPWNFPLHQIMAKVAPAIAAGFTMVLNPRNGAAQQLLAVRRRARDRVASRGGSTSQVTADVREAIARTPRSDMVSFTGSVREGQRVSALAAETIKKVTLELGGKSAFVIVDDAPLEKAIPGGVNNAMLNSGQTCSAWTRMLVPRARLDQVLEIASGAVARLTLGDPLDPKAKLGPLTSETQRRRVEGYIRRVCRKGRAHRGRQAARRVSPRPLPGAAIFSDVQSS